MLTADIDNVLKTNEAVSKFVLSIYVKNLATNLARFRLVYYPTNNLVMRPRDNHIWSGVFFWKWVN